MQIFFALWPEMCLRHGKRRIRSPFNKFCKLPDRRTLRDSYLITSRGESPWGTRKLKIEAMCSLERIQ